MKFLQLLPFQWVLRRNICLSLCVCVCAESSACCFSLSVYIPHPVLYVCVHRVRGHRRTFCVSIVTPECVATYRGGSLRRLMSSGGGGGGLISAPVECDYKQPGRRNK